MLHSCLNVHHLLSFSSDYYYSRSNAYVAAGADVSPGADHGGLHGFAPPLVGAADAVADYREQSLLELSGDGTAGCRRTERRREETV